VPSLYTEESPNAAFAPSFELHWRNFIVSPSVGGHYIAVGKRDSRTYASVIAGDI
jgi:hypothetical protein